ncbi:MAG TPA: class I SAM-dependent methyltransferase [Gemmatimonadales bacterium]|nr:class I SAM-dependent methyltransferase [Gemmatimonadales bacterium]
MTLPMPLAWSAVAREYARHIVPGFVPAARALCAYLDVHPGDRVLDVGCGPGTAAFVARELGADAVVGVDYAEEMVAVARERAAGDPRMDFRLGNALDLPVRDGIFDVALSTFGVIFAPDPVRAMAEMARALGPGGRAGLTAWPDTGIMGEYYAIVYRYLTMPAAPHDPHKWGDPAQARAWFDTAFDVALVQTVTVPYEAESPEEAWRIFRASAGRAAIAYRELDPAPRARLDAEMHAYFRRFAGPGGRVVWPREALVVCGRKREHGAASGEASATVTAP